MKDSIVNYLFSKGLKKLNLSIGEEAKEIVKEFLKGKTNLALEEIQDTFQELKETPLSIFYHVEDFKEMSTLLEQLTPEWLLEDFDLVSNIQETLKDKSLSPIEKQTIMFKYSLIYIILQLANKREANKLIPEEIPKLSFPRNNFLAVLDDALEGKGKLRGASYKLKIPKKLETTYEKVCFESLFLGLASYLKTTKKNYGVIKLTELMERVGYKKREGHGYKEELKLEALEFLELIRQSEILFLVNEVPEGIRKLFIDIKEGDFISVEPFIISIFKNYSSSGHLKDAIIQVKGLFDLERIYLTEDGGKVLALPLNEPEYKKLVMYLVFGKELCNLNEGRKVKIKVKELLKKIDIPIDYKNPKRVREKLRLLLERAKEEGFLKEYELQDMPNFKWGWFEGWLEGELWLFF